MSYRRPYGDKTQFNTSSRAQYDSFTDDRIPHGHANSLNQEGSDLPQRRGESMRGKHGGFAGQENIQSARGAQGSGDSALKQNLGTSDTHNRYRVEGKGYQQSSIRYIGRGRARHCREDNPNGFSTDFSHSGRGRGILASSSRRLLAWPERGRQNQRSWDSHFEDQKQEHDQKREGQKEKNEDNKRKQRHDTNAEQKIEETKASVNKVCHFGGKIIVRTEDEKILDNKAYHKLCSVQDIITAFSDAAGTKHVLWMTLPVIHLYGSKNQDKKKKKEFRDSKITELLNNASALRNSNSGFLLIHLDGLDPGDNFTGAFDEFADVKLQGLINDGSLFDDVYKKTRLSEYPGLETCTDILVLYVESADFLITSDFKTKLALDDCIIDTPELTLLKCVQKKRITEKKFHEIIREKADDLCRLQESRHIQMKAYFMPTEADDEAYACLQSSVPSDKITLHIFDKLRAAEYISAFSKNEAGGSYLVGIAEGTKTLGDYQTKIQRVTPVPVDDCRLVTNFIEERVLSTCLVCDYDGNEISPEDLVKIYFIPTADNTGYVVHISVSSVNGVVFYDKNGPVAYKVDLENTERKSTTRYNFKE